MAGRLYPLNLSLKPFAMYRICFALLCIAITITGYAQKKKPKPSAGDLVKDNAVASVQGNYATYRAAALQIWDYAELGYKETQSSALLQQMLRDNGFTVEPGVAGIPTAFVASFGTGSPVIGILAEYDALPGLSQQAVPEKQPAAGKDAGHGCGHHLFGTASVAAAVALKEQMQRGAIKGTVKVYGCPAEEGGSGKVYMVRAGLFNGVDAVIHWHPGDRNSTTVSSALANKSAKFRFNGISAHASASPEKGRSALDAVEAMDYMVNMMREHVPQDTRIHYVITNGGKAPNVIPDFAEVYYYVRHPDRTVVQQVFDRVSKAAEGAALGTGTTMSFEIIGGTYDLLINRTLATVMQQNLVKVGGVQYSPADSVFAEAIRSTLTGAVPPLSKAATIDSMVVKQSGLGSTDVGDVSWTVPTVGMYSATWVPGTPAHSWQAVACGGTDIGIKGMMVAAKAMACMGVDLFMEPGLINAAKAEFDASRGAGFRYVPLLGDRAPALNYRD